MSITFRAPPSPPHLVTIILLDGQNISDARAARGQQHTSLADWAAAMGGDLGVAGWVAGWAAGWEIGRAHV